MSMFISAGKTKFEREVQKVNPLYSKIKGIEIVLKQMQLSIMISMKVNIRYTNPTQIINTINWNYFYGVKLIE